MIGELRTLVEALERDGVPAGPERLRERIEVLDRLDASMPGDGELAQRVRVVQQQLEAANALVYTAIRQAIRQGDGREAMLRWWRAGDAAPGDAYDWLDELLAGVLQFDVPVEAQALAPEMVFYQPTPARHVFDLLERLQLGANDTLVDLGSGLGQLPLLTTICSDAGGTGIEIERAYLESARRCAQNLRLPNAHFIQGDARDPDFAVGSVFYLYTPFTGGILRNVLDALRYEAGRRAFRVCSYGPCTQRLAAEPWLACDGLPAADRVVIFHARTIGEN